MIMQQSQASVVVGRSMEPILFEGDTVELKDVSTCQAQPGFIYSFSMPELQRPVLHRLRKIEGKIFLFGGDRQPFEESVVYPTDLKQLERVLDRRQTPDAGDILFGLINLWGKERLIAPKHATIHWPWKKIISLGQSHRLNAILTEVLKETQLWAQVPQEFREQLAFTQYEAIERSVRLSQTYSKVQALLPKAKAIKGIKLAPELYFNPALRIMEDVDIYVGKGQLERASAVLEENGFTQTRESKLIASFYTQTTFTDETNGIGVDLHAQLLEEARFAFPLFWFPETEEEEFVYLATHCFLHWGRHGLNLLDLKLFLEQKKPDLNRCYEIAKRNGVLLRLSFTRMELEHWFNMQLPKIPSGELNALQKAQELLIKIFYSRVAEGNLYSNKKRLLQLLLSDSLVQFYRFWKNPVRRRMHLNWPP